MKRNQWYVIDPMKQRHCALLACRTEWEAEQMMALVSSVRSVDIYCPAIHRLPR